MKIGVQKSLLTGNIFTWVLNTKSVPYKLLALHLHRDVSHTELLQPHFISCRGALGSGGNVVLTEIYLSQSRFQQKLSGIGLSGLMSGSDFQRMN